METHSALLALCAENSPVTGEFPHKGQWRGALMFSLICAWINVCVNNLEAGDLRRHRAHYDVIVMANGLTVVWFVVFVWCDIVRFSWIIFPRIPFTGNGYWPGVKIFLDSFVIYMHSVPVHDKMKKRRISPKPVRSSKSILHVSKTNTCLFQSMSPLHRLWGCLFGTVSVACGVNVL